MLSDVFYVCLNLFVCLLVSLCYLTFSFSLSSLSSFCLFPLSFSFRFYIRFFLCESSLLSPTLCHWSYQFNLSMQTHICKLQLCPLCQTRPLLDYKNTHKKIGDFPSSSFLHIIYILFVFAFLLACSHWLCKFAFKLTSL